MFNFKTLLLTTVATLGLAANVQGCKNCRLLVYGPNEQMKETIDYARKNADALLKEYEAVINDPKTIAHIKAKLLDLADTTHKAMIHITKAKRSPEEILMDKNAMKAFETLFTKIFDFHSFVDTFCTQAQAPLLNNLLHKWVTEPDIHLKAILKHDTPKKQIAAEMSHNFDGFRKECIALEKGCQNATKIVDILLNIFSEHKELFLELGQALHRVLKDDAFFAEIEKSKPHHKFPKTDSTVHLLAVSFTLFYKLRFNQQVDSAIKIISAT